MKVLWITNIAFPEAIQGITGSSELKGSGGWLLGACYSILDTDDSVQIAVASICDLVQELRIIQGNRIKYYLIPKGKGNEKFNNEYNKYWIIISNDFKPDIIHLHGTECSHGLSYINACSNRGVVVSIQGLTTYCAKYYMCGLNKWEIIKNITFHDIIRGSIFWQKNYFAQRSLYENEILKKCLYAVGRTNWDRVHSTQINPQIKYFSCNETLRSEFYSGELWDYTACNKHTIFLSQASYPIKGLHQFLKALRIVVKSYPDTVVRIAGKDIINRTGFKNKMKYTGYAKLLSSFINKNQLQENIVFIGNLDADEMKNEYLKCNLFVCPSTIENSSNSLGEAQILGVPVACSYVGGLPDMMVGNEHNMYRFDEFEMLADIICRVFRYEENQINMSAIAQKRHNRSINAQKMLEIYKSVLNDGDPF